MHRKMGAMVSVLTFGVIAVCSGFTISGYVRDDATGKPIPQAVVVTKNDFMITRTDENGYFKLNNSVALSQPLHMKKKLGRLHWDMRTNMMRWIGLGDVQAIEITTMRGQKVYSSMPGKVRGSVSIPAMAHGSYVVRLRFAEGVFTQRVVNVGTVQQIPVWGAALSGGKVTAMAGVRDSMADIMVMARGYKGIELSMENGVDNGVVFCEKDPSEYVFPRDTMRKYELTIAPADLAYLDKNALVLDEIKEYVPCKFVHNGVDYGTVGIRYRGMTSLTSCFDEQGNKICDKISFTIKFDRYNKNTLFYGLKRINLNSMGGDVSYAHEQLTASLFEEMGIVTPRTAYCRVMLNGAYHGLFLTVENVDADFTKNRFSRNGKGNVYKGIWPSKVHEDSSFLYGLRTNDGPDDTPDISRAIAFKKAVEKMGGADFRQQVRPWLDLYYTMRFFLVDRATIQCDGLFTWYIGDGWQGNGNYYWYEENSPKGQFWLLPWDFDFSFTRPDVLFDVVGMPKWFEPCDDTTLYPIPGSSDKYMPPSRDNLIKQLGIHGFEIFGRYCDMFLSGSFSSDSLQGKLTRWEKLIDRAVREDKNGHDYEEWITAIRGLKNSTDFYRDNIYYQVHPILTTELPPPDQTPHPYIGLELVKNNNFETEPENDSLCNFETIVSRKTTVLVTKNGDAPLSGKSDVRFSMIFRDDPGTWNEWAVLLLQVDSSCNNIDMREVRRLAVDMRLEGMETRRLRIELNDDVSDQDSAVLGYDFTLSNKSKTIDIPVHKLSYPDWGSQSVKLQDVLKKVSGLKICCSPEWDGAGNMIKKSDTVGIRIDNIRFVK